jgi:hypothetical protein
MQEVREQRLGPELAKPELQLEVRLVFFLQADLLALVVLGIFALLDLQEKIRVVVRLWGSYFEFNEFGLSFD